MEWSGCERCRVEGGCVVCMYACMTCGIMMGREVERAQHIIIINISCGFCE